MLIKQLILQNDNQLTADNQNPKQLRMFLWSDLTKSP